MVLMKLARISGRCEELGSSTYFRLLNVSSVGSPGEIEVNFFQTLPDKENNYLISGNEQNSRYGAIMIDWT